MENKIFHTVCLLMIALFPLATYADNCSIDYAITSWWYGYSNTNQPLLRTYTDTTVTINEVAQQVVYDCVDDGVLEPLKFILGKDDQTYICFEEQIIGDIMKYRQEEIGQSLTLGQCAGEVANSDPSIAIPHDSTNFNFQGSPCPFDNGGYQVTASIQNQGENLCDDSVSSSAILANDTITISACTEAGTNSYDTPLDSELTCIQGIEANTLGTGDDGGQFLILGASFEGVQRFYCARYAVEGDVITISLHLTPDSLSCDIAATYETVVAGNFIQFVLAPPECPDNHCQNNGNCTARVAENMTIVYDCDCTEEYTGATCETEIVCEPACQNNATCDIQGGVPICECLPGFNGTACEEDIDDCAADPCATLEKCVDQVNGFTCVAQTTLEPTTVKPTTVEPTTVKPTVGATKEDATGGLATKDSSNVDMATEWPTNSTGGYQDWTTEEPTNSTEIDPCASNPCLSNQTCEALSGTDYSCSDEDEFSWLPVIIGVAVAVVFAVIAALIYFCCYYCCYDNPTADDTSMAASTEKIVKKGRTVPQDDIPPFPAVLPAPNKVNIWRSEAVYTPGLQYPHVMVGNYPLDNGIPVDYAVPFEDGSVEVHPGFVKPLQQTVSRPAQRPQPAQQAPVIVAGLGPAGSAVEPQRPMAVQQIDSNGMLTGGYANNGLVIGEERNVGYDMVNI